MCNWFHWQLWSIKYLKFIKLQLQKVQMRRKRKVKNWWCWRKNLVNWQKLNKASKDRLTRLICFLWIGLSEVRIRGFLSTRFRRKNRKENLMRCIKEFWLIASSILTLPSWKQWKLGRRAPRETLSRTRWAWFASLLRWAKSMRVSHS